MPLKIFSFIQAYFSSTLWCVFLWLAKQLYLFLHLYHHHLVAVSEFVNGGELLGLCQSYGVLPEELVRIYVAEISLAIGKLLFIFCLQLQKGLIYSHTWQHLHVCPFSVWKEDRWLLIKYCILKDILDSSLSLWVLLWLYISYTFSALPISIHTLCIKHWYYLESFLCRFLTQCWCYLPRPQAGEHSPWWWRPRYADRLWISKVAQVWISNHDNMRH